MIKCSNCGKELEDGSAFCDNCGTPVVASAAGTADQQAAAYQQAATEQQAMAYQQQVAQQSAVYQQAAASQQTVNTFCTNCGAPVPVGTAFCEVCGASVAAQTTQTQTVPVQAVAGRKAAKKKPPKAMLAIIAVVCVAIVGVGAFLFLRKDDKASGVDYAYYIKDKELFYTGPDVREPLQVTDKLMSQSDVSNSILADLSNNIGVYVVKSDTGNLIFFPSRMDYYDNVINLYYKQLTGAEKEAQKIDSDIMAYSVNDTATLVTYIKDDYSLYSYDLKKGEKEKISSDIDEYKVSDDGKRVYYLNDDEVLYMWTPEGGKEKVDSDVTQVCYNTDDFQTIYYLKEDSFYKKMIGSDKEKIASNVEYVIRVYESGAAYYIRDNSSDQSVYNYIYDDLAEEDLNLTQPEWPESPSRYNYSSDTAYNAAVEAYNKAREEYNTKYEEYNQKLGRDNIRRDLENDDLFHLECYELCYYDGAKEETVTEELIGKYNYDLAVDSAVIVYGAIDSKSFEKLKLSEFETYNAYEIKNNTMSKLRESTYAYAAVGANASLIETESDQNILITAMVNPNGDSIWYCEYGEEEEEEEEEPESDLYVIRISDGKLQTPELYDSDVYRDNLSFTVDGQICYFKDYKNSKGELYIDRKSVDYDVYAYGADYDNDKLYYFTDYSDSKEQGTLKVYANGKAEKIADDVREYVIAGDNVYYLGDYSQKSYKGELYQYSGGQSKKIDDDVVGISAAYSDSSVQGGAYRFGWGW